MAKEQDYYKSLYEIAAEVNSARTPDIVGNAIVESLAKAVGVKACSLMLLTPDREFLLHTASYGLSDGYIRKGPLSAKKNIPAAFDACPVYIEDATEYQEESQKEGIVSILSLPVMLREEVVGVIRVYTSERRSFTNDDINFINIVANLGAIALENARLYDSVKKDYDSFREEILEWRAALGYEWLAQETVVPFSE